MRIFIDIVKVLNRIFCISKLSFLIPVKNYLKTNKISIFILIKIKDKDEGAGFNKPLRIF